MQHRTRELTKEQAAKYLGVVPRTVQNLIERGTLAFHGCAGSFIFDRRQFGPNVQDKIKTHRCWERLGKVRKHSEILGNQALALVDPKQDCAR
jgi:excisionase family DNA binding protein